MLQVPLRSARFHVLEPVLLQAVHQSGGWPYRVGLASRVEPTAWALLALSAVSPTPALEAARSRAWMWLASLQRADGLLVEPSTPGPNYGWNGLALLAAAAPTDADTDEMSRRLIEGLLAVKGIQLEGGPAPIRQDNRLQGWSWTEGTFSWVEPTACCLLAVKKVGVTGDLASQRIAEAEAVLFDRMCDGGGWNYGNSEVLGQDLRPYVPTTALALLALQDKAAHPAVESSLAWLSANALSERSAMALSLVAIALAVFRRPHATVLDALAEQAPRTPLDSMHLTALALFAGTMDDHQAQALRLS